MQRRTASLQKRSLATLKIALEAMRRMIDECDETVARTSASGPRFNRR
jgi:hypothetical protein